MSGGRLFRFESHGTPTLLLFRYCFSPLPSRALSQRRIIAHAPSRVLYSACVLAAQALRPPRSTAPPRLPPPVSLRFLLPSSAACPDQSAGVATGIARAAYGPALQASSLKFARGCATMDNPSLPARLTLLPTDVSEEYPRRKCRAAHRALAFAFVLSLSLYAFYKQAQQIERAKEGGRCLDSLADHSGSPRPPR